MRREIDPDCEMSNVVRFKKPTTIQPPDGATRHEGTTSSVALPPRISEIRDAQTQLKEDVRVTILMIDLAIVRARQWASATEDPRIKRDIDGHLAAIEGLLEITRQKAQAL